MLPAHVFVTNLAFRITHPKPCLGSTRHRCNKTHPPRSAFMLVGAKHKANVGEVESQHTEEVSALISELLAAGSAALGVLEAPGETPCVPNGVPGAFSRRGVTVR